MIVCELDCTRRTVMPWLNSWHSLQANAEEDQRRVKLHLVTLPGGGVGCGVVWSIVFQRTGAAAGTIWNVVRRDVGLIFRRPAFLSAELQAPTAHGTLADLRFGTRRADQPVSYGPEHSHTARGTSGASRPSCSGIRRGETCLSRSPAWRVLRALHRA